ncbi:unnamed protein product, partial [Rotaria sp. Silwood2]
KTDVSISQDYHSIEEGKQAVLKTPYNRFPDIGEATNETTSDMKKAEEFTESILNNKSSANMSETDTVRDVPSQLFGSQNQQCLFSDSTNGINLHDASGNLADIRADRVQYGLELDSDSSESGSKFKTSYWSVPD